jgi:hypothetical protein
MEQKQEGPDHTEQQPGAISAEKGLEHGLAGNLEPEHREFLLSRHKTVDLNPLPTMDPADPLNWPSWKVLCRLAEFEQS